MTRNRYRIDEEVSVCHYSPRLPLFDSIKPSTNRMIDLLSTLTASCLLVMPRLRRLLKASAMDVPMMNVNLEMYTSCLCYTQI